MTKPWSAYNISKESVVKLRLPRCTDASCVPYHAKEVVASVKMHVRLHLTNGRHPQVDLRECTFRHECLCMHAICAGTVTVSKPAKLLARRCIHKHVFNTSTTFPPLLNAHLRGYDGTHCTAVGR
eukprot:m.1114899 g.1114899  ORF g.1114899 m.1114899 type:complete len:125 (-) comp24368_c0_seq28:1398-1772(-)